MGTSSRYDGPKGKNPLLPEDYISKNLEETPKEKKEESRWKDAKTDMTKYLKNETSGKKVVSTHIKALGGSKKAASNSIGAKKATIALGNFLSNSSSNGVKKFLDQNNIRYQNRNVEDVLSDIANFLSPPGNTKEESLVREAMFNTIGQLYDNIIENGGNIEILDSLTSELFNEIMNNFISEVIFQRLIKDLGSREEMSEKPIQDLITLENDIKMYIEGTVENTLSKQQYKEYDYSDIKLNSVVEGLYQECYEALEGVI